LEQQYFLELKAELESETKTNRNCKTKPNQINNLSVINAIVISEMKQQLKAVLD